MKSYINGVQHIGIETNVFDETIKFYLQFGFENIYQTVIKETGQKVVFLALEAYLLEVYEGEMDRDKGLGALEHLALDCNDIEGLYKEIKKEDIKILTDIEYLPFWDNGIKYFIIQGPNKEKVEFCQRLAGGNIDGNEEEV